MPVNKDILVRINEAVVDKATMSSFIDDSRYFIASEIAKVVKRFVDPNTDDLLTVGMLGFAEATKAYSPDKGLFYSFAGLVIRRRTIDELQRTRRKLSMNTSEYNDELLAPIAYNNYRDQTDQMERIESINEFSSELLVFGIDFKKLEKVTPKSDKNKRLYQNLAKYIYKNKVLLSEFKLKKVLPVKVLVEAFGLNRKKIERGRTYIIACIVVLDERYKTINSYMKGGE